jgi:hypothetical protein
MIMKRLMLALVISLALPLSACLSPSIVQVNGQIDQSDKTMTVPLGNSLLIGSIKQRLQFFGWKLVVSRGPLHTVGTVGEKTNIKTSGTFNTRYKLIIRQFQFDTCVITQSPAIDFDLSLIDNSTGEEVLTQGGRDCVLRATDSFIAALNGTH